jgi:hypothetical protein
MIRMGLERAKIIYMVALFLGASLILRGSTVVRVFRLSPARVLELRAFPLAGS